MTIYPHSSPHLQIRLSLVHPFLPQDLDLPCNARASCQYSYNMYIIVKVHIHRPRLMQTRQIFITFQTFIGQKNKRNPTLNLFYGGDRRPPSAISMYGGGVQDP